MLNRITREGELCIERPFAVAFTQLQSSGGSCTIFGRIGITCTTSLRSTTFVRLDLIFRLQECFKPQDPIVG